MDQHTQTIASLYEAHSSGDTETIAEHIRRTAETVPYIKSSRPLPSDIIEYMSEESEEINETDFI